MKKGKPIVASPSVVTLLVQLITIEGQSCGSLNHIVQASATDPNSYLELPDCGDFPDYCRCRAVYSGSTIITWELKLLYEGGGPCDGFWWFRLVTPATSPIGDYGIYDGSTVDTNGGTAAVSIY